MKVVAPSKNNEKKNSPLLYMTLINRFEESCDTFAKDKNPMSSMTFGSICPK